MNKKQQRYIEMQICIALQNMQIRLELGLKIDLERVANLKIKELKFNLQKQLLDFDNRMAKLGIETRARNNNKDTI